MIRSNIVITVYLFILIRLFSNVLDENGFAFLTVPEMICFLLFLTGQNITIFSTTESRTKMGRAGSGQ